ncbi:hypothetical protein IJI89_02130 [Candidatus Saccharibacteria bacterium]|nr:hypothetical protein [Candidatus Saccharibacteria bacterium]
MKRTVRSGVSPTNVFFIVIVSLLVVLVAGVAVLVGTGVIKLGGGDEPGTSEDDGKELVENPYIRVSANGNLIEVENLEFYLPYAFKNGDKGNGVYHFILDEVESQAEVIVYVEKSSLTPDKYLKKKDNSLSITNQSYTVNGFSWLEASSEDGLAYVGKFGKEMYAVICKVKMDSSATVDAMRMIPKTLYMKKLYK